MKLLISWVLFIVVLMPGMLHAKEKEYREYRGLVVLEDRSGYQGPAPEVEVRIVGGFGSPSRTTAHGEFVIKLPNSLPPGTRIRISIIKEGWRISVPPNGETYVPLDETEISQVILLPKDSVKFLPEDQIERKSLVSG